MEMTGNDKMIAAPDWMICGDTDRMFDMQLQEILALNVEHKFKTAVKSNDASRLYEIIFHFLNMNALRIDKKLYDAHFKEIRDNEYLDSFKENLRAEENGVAARIINQMNSTYTRILSEYVKLAIDIMSGVKVTYFDRKNIHYTNDNIFVAFNIKATDNYEIWKTFFAPDEQLGSGAERVASMRLASGEISEFKEFTKKYNKANPDSKIYSGNFVTAICDNSKSSQNVVSIIKDTIMMNKVFYEMDQFNPRILTDIQQILIDKKTFPFKLMMI